LTFTPVQAEYVFEYFVLAVKNAFLLLAVIAREIAYYRIEIILYIISWLYRKLIKLGEVSARCGTVLLHKICTDIIILLCGTFVISHCDKGTDKVCMHFFIGLVKHCGTLTKRYYFGKFAHRVK
jgi:hypothetical protein